MRRIVSAKITHLALCPRGKNGFSTIYKSDDLDGDRPEFSRFLLCKGMDEKGLLTAVVYAPERPDGDHHVASADVIQKAAYESMQGGGLRLNVRHKGKDLSEKDAFVAESFLVAKGDERFKDLTDYDGRPVGDLTGAWAVVVKIENESLRKAYREGEWSGVSMEGIAALRTVKSDDDDDTDAGDDPAGDDEMSLTEAQVEKILKSNNEALAAVVATAVAKAITDTKKVKKGEDEDEDDETNSRRRRRRSLSQRVLAGDMPHCSIEKEMKNRRKADLVKDMEEAEEDGDDMQVLQCMESIKAIDMEIAELTKLEKEEMAKRRASIQKAMAPAGTSFNGINLSGGGDGKALPLSSFVGIQKSEETNGDLAIGRALSNTMARLSGTASK